MAPEQTPQNQPLSPAEYLDQVHTVHHVGTVDRDALTQLLGHAEKGHTEGDELELNSALMLDENSDTLRSLYFDGTKFSAQYFEASTSQQVGIIREGLQDELLESLEALSGDGSKPDISEGGDIAWFTTGFLRMWGLRLEDVQHTAPLAGTGDTDSRKYIDTYLTRRHDNARARLESAQASTPDDMVNITKLESKVRAVEETQRFVEQTDIDTKPKGAHAATSPTYREVFDLMQRFGESPIWDYESEADSSGISPFKTVLEQHPELAGEVQTLAAELLQTVQDLTGQDLDKILLVNLLKTHGRQHLRDQDAGAHTVDAVSQVGLGNAQGRTFGQTSIIELADSQSGNVEVYMHEGRTDDERTEHLANGEIHPAIRREIGSVSLTALNQ